MNNSKLRGWFPILTAIIMLIFWTLFAVLLPMQEPYINWVMNDHWTWINVLGFAGSVFGLFALMTLHHYISGPTLFDQLGYGLATLGVVILTSVLFFEAFILKGIATIQPELIVLNQGFYEHQPFVMANLIGGSCMSIGFVVLGLTLVKQQEFKSWKLVMLMIAIPMFAIVLMPGNVRLLGVLLYAISFIGLGVEMIKRSSKSIDPKSK